MSPNGLMMKATDYSCLREDVCDGREFYTAFGSFQSADLSFEVIVLSLQIVDVMLEIKHTVRTFKRSSTKGLCNNYYYEQELATEVKSFKHFLRKLCRH